MHEPTDAFIQTYVDRLRATDGRVDVEVLPDRRVRVVDARGRTHIVDLHNTWRSVRAYAERPQDLTTALDRSIGALLAIPTDAPDLAEALRIVVRPAESMRRKVETNGPMVVTPAAPGLVGLPVVDLGDSFQFLGIEDLKAGGVNPHRALSLAMERTWEVELEPKLDAHGDHPIVLQCGATYESSLLLFDNWWERIGDWVTGRIVVAVPTRDVLLVTGSEDSAGLGETRRCVDAAFRRDAAYLLSDELLVWVGLGDARGLSGWARWPLD